MTGFREDVVLSSFWDVETLGKKADPEDTEPVPPTPETPGIIMYTSGSTGLVTHFIPLTFFNYICLKGIQRV